MREWVGKGKKATTSSFSISTLRQPIRGFGLESSEVPQAVTGQQAINKPRSQDLSRISMRPQAKLTVNQPGDVYEQEADRVAQQVMQRMSKPANQQSVQRQEQPKVQTKAIPAKSSPKPSATKIKENPQKQTEADKQDKLGLRKDKDSKDKQAKDGKANERTPKQKQDDLDKALAEAYQLIKDDNTSSQAVKQRLPGIKSKYKMTSLELVVKRKNGLKETVYVKGKINPTGETGEEEISGESKKLTNEQIKNLVTDAKSDWRQVKATHLKDPSIMKQIIAFRKGEVQLIIDQVKKKLGGAFKAVAPGSNDLTSDYDVTFDASGNQSLEIKAVKTFNEIFRKKWGKESGTVFDTNVYTTGHMPIGEGETKKEEKTKKEEFKKETEWQMTQMAEKSSLANQDVMSLLKIRRFMSDAQWKQHKKNIVNGIHNSDDIREMKKRLKEVDNLYKLSNTQMERKIDELNKDVIKIDKSIKNRIKYIRRKSRIKYIKNTNPDAEMEASNRLYEEYLGKVDLPLKELEKLKPEVTQAGVRTKEQSEKLDKLTLQLQDLRSMALVFANEAYHTGGAVEHVVLNQQMQLNISITNQQYLQSINEQTGFAVEQINHNEDMGTAFWKSAKYVDRLCDAIEKIDLKNFNRPEEQKKLSNLAKTLLQIKKAPDKTDQEKSEEAKTTGQKDGYTSKEAFLQAVVNLNVKVNQEIRNKLSENTDNRNRNRN